MWLNLQGVQANLLLKKTACNCGILINVTYILSVSNFHMRCKCYPRVEDNVPFIYVSGDILDVRYTIFNRNRSISEDNVTLYQRLSVILRVLERKKMIDQSKYLLLRKFHRQRFRYYGSCFYTISLVLIAPQFYHNTYYWLWMSSYVTHVMFCS